MRRAVILSFVLLAAAAFGDPSAQPAPQPWIDDVGIIGIPSPPDTILVGQVFHPAVLIRNYSRYGEPGVQVQMRIYEDSALFYWQRQMVNLPAEDTVTLTFVVDIVCCDTTTLLFEGILDSGDVNPRNDTFRKVVHVVRDSSRARIPQHRHFNDVGITRIISPPETLWDTSSVWQSTVEVRNFSNEVQGRCLEWMIMHDTLCVYADSLRAELPGRTTDTFFLPTGLRPGFWLACRLKPHDVNPRNDSDAVRPVFIATRDIGCSWVQEPPESAQVGYEFPVEVRITNYCPREPASFWFVGEWSDQENGGLIVDERCRFDGLAAGADTVWRSEMVPVYVVDTSRYPERPTCGKFYVASWNANPDNDTLRLHIRLIVTGLEGGAVTKDGDAGQCRTVVRAMLRMGDRTQETGYRTGLLDITGRRVMDLQPGENDIRHVAPGVYFLRSADGRSRTAVHRVVIAR